MNKFLKTGIAVAMLAGVATPALAQTNEVTTTGTTTIIRPVTIEEDAGLAFGRIVRPSTGGGTVTMTDAADTVSASGGALALNDSTSRAKYTITGEGAQTVSITIGTLTMTHTNGTDTLAVTLDPDLGSTVVLSNALGAEGTATLNIGGSFPISSTTVTGAYSGTFDVTVAYQ